MREVQVHAFKQKNKGKGTFLDAIKAATNKGFNSKGFLVYPYQLYIKEDNSEDQTLYAIARGIYITASVTSNNIQIQTSDTLAINVTYNNFKHTMTFLNRRFIEEEKYANWVDMSEYLLALLDNK